jgi:hypothetical protein
MRLRHYHNVRFEEDTFSKSRNRPFALNGLKTHPAPPKASAWVAKTPILPYPRRRREKLPRFGGRTAISRFTDFILPARVPISSRVYITFPFLQGWIPATGCQRSRPDTLDLPYFGGPTIDTDLHARASVTVVHICLHPLPIFKFRPVPVAFNLISALRSDDPFIIPIV